MILLEKYELDELTGEVKNILTGSFITLTKHNIMIVMCKRNKVHEFRIEKKGTTYTATKVRYGKYYKS